MDMAGIRSAAFDEVVPDIAIAFGEIVASQIGKSRHDVPPSATVA
jgi:hypothetical protein